MTPTNMVIVRIADAPMDPHAEARSFAERFASSGAIVTFLGQVRGEGGAVDALSLHHYPGFTERQIQAITAEACRRWPLDGALVVHRVGVLAPADPIVFIAAASAHRRAAFEAVDFLMDYLKCDAPFWKQEVAEGKTRWIDPRAEDHEDKSRWRANELTES